jgi:hypothetical protein
MKLSTFAFLLFLLLAFQVAMSGEPSRSSGGESGLEALDGFLQSSPIPPDCEILGIAGFFGQLNPGQWLILTRSQAEGGVLRESVWKEGAVSGERLLSVLPGQDIPDLPLFRDTLRFDSGAVFREAERVAAERQVAFAGVHYQLRVRDAGKEPVWVLSLLNRSQVQQGVLYFSATTGDLLCESWHKASQISPLTMAGRPGDSQ